MPDRTASTQNPILDRLGPYKLLRLIGSGGTSQVYLAEREDEQFQQQVAVKLITWGPDAATRERRFRAERQILARLEHPNVARLYDGGAAPDGRLYFVLEYVDGRPINQYCREDQVPLRRRLELFRDVCSAVSFAHQNLIVHRDLKPANILVTGDGVPKLLDFGIAKVLEPEAFPYPVELTQPDQKPMTPRYASPEQIRGEPITTATDVYALGLVLYELLTGRHPYELGQSVPRIEWVVCEKEPAKPSVTVARSSTLAEDTTETAGPTWNVRPRQLAGDLDNIVLKALEKDPRDRYSSSRELADDIERHLARQPVLARPATWRYRSGRFLRRHAFGAAVTTLFLVLLISFTLALGILSRRLAQERDEARLERDRAEQISDFLEDIFTEADPGRAQGRTVTAQEILQKGADRIQRDLEDQPLVQARLMSTIGSIDRKLGWYEAARPLLEQGLEMRRRQLGDDSLEVASSLDAVATLHLDEGNYEASYQLFAESVEIRRRALGEDHLALAPSYQGRATTLRHLGKYEESEALFLRALDIRRRELGSDHLDLAVNVTELAILYRVLHRYSEAEERLREALAIREHNLQHDHPELADNLDQLASIYYFQGDFDRADTLFRRVLDIREKVLGDTHPDLAASLNNLSLIHTARGSYITAESLLLKATEIMGLSTNYLERALMLSNLGDVYREQGDYERSESRYLAAFECFELTPKSPHFFAGFLQRLAILYRELGRYEQAEPLLLRSLEKLESVSQGDHPVLASCFYELALLYFAQARNEEGESYLRLAEEMSAARFAKNPDHRGDRTALAKTLLLRGERYAAEGKTRDARDAWRRALETIEPVAEGSDVVLFRDIQVKALLHLGRLEEARPVAEQLWRKRWREPAFVELARHNGISARP